MPTRRINRPIHIDDEGGGDPGGGGEGGDDDPSGPGGGGIHFHTGLTRPLWPNGGALIQDSFTGSLPFGQFRHADFHFVTPWPGGGLAYLMRDNLDPRMLWHGPRMLSTTGNYSGAAIIQRNYSSNRPVMNFEVLAVRDGALEFFFTNDGQWHGPLPLISVDDRGAEISLPLPPLTGNPSLIQGSYGGSDHPNFEAVIARADAGIVHIWRNNQQQMLWRVGAPQIGGPDRPHGDSCSPLSDLVEVEAAANQPSLRAFLVMNGIDPASAGLRSYGVPSLRGLLNGNPRGG